MSTVVAPPAAGHLAPRPSRTPRILVIGSVAAIVAAVVLSDSSAGRWAVAVIVGLTLLLVALEDEVDGLFAVIGFLIVLGLLRRLLTTVQPALLNDPLLLVAPSVIGALAVIAIGRGALKPPSALVLLISAFVAVTAVSVLNAGDLSVTDNAEGLLFWTVPVLAFPVGRAFLDHRDLRRLLRLVAIVGAGSCLVGLYQVLIDLPPWDLDWVETNGYAALGIQGFATVHPFGWMSSHTEFAQLAALVAVICGLELLDARRTGERTTFWLATGGLGVSGLSLALSGVRTAQLLALLAVVVMLLASGRVRVTHTVVVLTISVVLLVGGVRLLGVNDWTEDGAVGLVRRSALGVTDPLDPETSSLRIHVSLTRFALETLDDHPLGSGTASGTQAKSNGRSRWNAENDLANAALAFGFVGVALVLAITAVGLHHAWRRARVRPDVVTLAVLGMLVLSLRYWWTGAHYAMAMIVWVALGFTDRPARS